MGGAASTKQGRKSRHYKPSLPEISPPKTEKPEYAGNDCKWHRKHCSDSDLTYATTIREAYPFDEEAKRSVKQEHKYTRYGHADHVIDTGPKILNCDVCGVFIATRDDSYPFYYCRKCRGAGRRLELCMKCYRRGALGSGGLRKDPMTSMYDTPQEKAAKREVARASASSSCGLTDAHRQPPGASTAGVWLPSPLPSGAMVQPPGIPRAGHPEPDGDMDVLDLEVGGGDRNWEPSVMSKTPSVGSRQSLGPGSQPPSLGVRSQSPGPGVAGPVASQSQSPGPGVAGPVAKGGPLPPHALYNGPELGGDRSTNSANYNARISVSLSPRGDSSLALLSVGHALSNASGDRSSGRARSPSPGSQSSPKLPPVNARNRRESSPAVLAAASLPRWVDQRVPPSGVWTGTTFEDKTTRTTSRELIFATSGQLTGSGVGIDEGANISGKFVHKKESVSWVEVHSWGRVKFDGTISWRGSCCVISGTFVATDGGTGRLELEAPR